MTVAVETRRDANRACVAPAGTFDLSHADRVVRAIAEAEATLAGSEHVDIDLAAIEDIDGAGAALLAGFLGRLTAGGCTVDLLDGRNDDARRLVEFYWQRRSETRPQPVASRSLLDVIGARVAAVPSAMAGALGFLGHTVAATGAAALTPGAVDWRSVPRLFQTIGADGMLVTSAANLLVGLIVGVLGVSQLGRFGATVYVPELVVVAHFRELGPLVTAIVVAGRSGAGLASELATMQVSEEVDALRVMGFDPIRWLVVPRCLALVVVLPLLTWIGSVLAIAGGMAAASALTEMSARNYLAATSATITGSIFLGGLAKTPFLGLAIGLIACAQGLAARGGALAVGSRTTRAVVLSIFGVIAISALFTVVYGIVGI